MSTSRYLTGQRYSFSSLFIKNDFTVVIPTIQRDYAQGRATKSEVRESFLLALRQYLSSNTPNHDLDFVYGSTETIEDSVRFIPLDGQQRLTTLFLLHWYLANISGHLKHFRSYILKDNKSRFTYLTRPSTTEFIHALLTNDVALDELVDPPNSSSSGSVSGLVRNEGWFFLSWKFDPTIQSMLNMLDAIHEKFQGKKEFYNRLIDPDAPAITFLYLDLEEFRLTEDLYIKMNARGKPLTPFENFKAKLEKHIGEIDVNNNELSYQKHFSHQIDTTWADLFWNYRHLVGKPYTYDAELMNYVRTIIAAQYCSENSPNLNFARDLVSNVSATDEMDDNISFYKYANQNALGVGFVEYLIKSLDALCQGNIRINKLLVTNYYFNEEAIFEKALRSALSMPERVIFHAYVKFLIVNPVDREGLHQWMRVVHNLVENSRIEEVEQMLSAFRGIERLLPVSNEILLYLTEPTCEINFFSPAQVEEEKIKAHLILSSSTWLELIEKSEKEIFHNGQLGYILEFAGIWGFYATHKSLAWTKEQNDSYQLIFVSYQNRSKSLFEFEDNSNNRFLLERAILSKGDYLIPASNNRYNFCSSKRVNNYQRDYSWNRLLRLTSDDPDGVWRTKRKMVKDLLDDIRYNSEDVSSSLQLIVKDHVPGWRKYFVADPRLIEYCAQGFVSFRYDDAGNELIDLYKESQLNHYHIDLYIYNLFLNCLSPEFAELTPFTTLEPLSVRGTYEQSCVVLGGWTEGQYSYELKIERAINEFAVELKQTQVNSEQEEVLPNLKEVLVRFGYTRKDGISTWARNFNSETELLSHIKLLCAEFQKNVVNKKVVVR